MNDIAREIARDPMSELTERVNWKPSRIEALRSYEINIRFLDRGVLVSVGCKQIAYESVETFMTAFNNYVERPYDVQGAWKKSFDEQDKIR
jgi:hypothetical protein